jgi:hypothetical protein
MDRYDGGVKLPNGDHAIVDDAKLRGYALNPEHPRGRHHARLFASLLGIDAESAWLLAAALKRAARENEATPGKPSLYGRKFEVDFEMTGPRGTYTVASVWIIRSSETVPRLVTAYVR